MVYDDFTRLCNDDPETFTQAGNADPEVTRCFQAGPLDEFPALLPALLSQSLGDGRRVTQFAGLWLRRLGADALIFPSARTNVYATLAGGELTGGRSGISLITEGRRRRYSPASLTTRLNGSDLPMFGGDFMSGESAPAIIQEGTRIEQVRSGDSAGSLRIAGLEEQRESFYQLAVWTHFMINSDSATHASTPMSCSRSRENWPRLAR